MSDTDDVRRIGINLKVTSPNGSCTIERRYTKLRTDARIALRVVISFDTWKWSTIGMTNKMPVKNTKLTPTLRRVGI